VTDSGYVVAIKHSARQRCAAAGEWVAENGPTREFRSKRAAREWAMRERERDAPVWVQDAAPWDRSDVDGYLVGGERPATAVPDPKESEQADFGEMSSEDGE
jgi:hypothetical protein